MASTVELTDEELVRKGRTYADGFVGGTIESFIPSLWGAVQLLLSSVVFFMIGGFVGIWITYRLLSDPLRTSSLPSTRRAAGVA